MTATYTLPGVLLSGTHASRPAANAVAKGTLYAETDTAQTYQSDGSSTWTAWGAAAGGMANPMTTPGDIIVGGTAGAPTALAKGSDSTVLTVSASTHLPVWQAPTTGTPTAVGCRAYNTGNISCTGGQDNVMTLDSEAFDTDAFHSVSTNTSRMTVPTGKGGKYVISGDIFMSGATSADYLAIKLNNTSFLAVQSCAGNHNTISTVAALAQGDYVELVVNPGTGRTVSGLASYSPAFGLLMVGS